MFVLCIKIVFRILRLYGEIKSQSSVLPYKIQKQYIISKVDFFVTGGEKDTLITL